MQYLEMIKRTLGLICLVFAFLFQLSWNNKAMGQDVYEALGVNPLELLAFPEFSLSTIEDSAQFSSSSVDTEGIVVFKFFHPGCEYCQEEAAHLSAKQDSLNHIKTLWVSGPRAKLESQREFAETYRLNELSPLAIGKVANAELFDKVGTQGFPFTAVYVDGVLVKRYRGQNMALSELIKLNMAYANYAGVRIGRE